MLPSSKKYLVDGGMGPKVATGVMIACFMAGAIGIAGVSQILHQYIPHSVVDCDHEHGDEEEGKVGDEEAGHHHHDHPPPKKPVAPHRMGSLPGASSNGSHPSYGATNEDHPHQLSKRPSLHTTLSTKVSQIVTGSKQFCDEHGQCFGYSDPCGAECFRNIQHNRPPRFLNWTSGKIPTRPAGLRSQTTPNERQPLLRAPEDNSLTPTASGPATMESSQASLPSTNGHSLHKQTSQASLSSHHTTSSASSHSSNSAHTKHHHHVPTNVFLSIGLQTSTAIALHKIPEGFITYATNHANPRLGFSIFLALFIHNITEGFALALPLYLAINSRWKAMFWSALLGGVSQPLGAGVAALWFKIARRGGREGGGEPGETVYGAMFAVTAGIMAMVSLQLFGESLELTHSRRLCFIGAFVGMGILGVSSALTA
jgi:ZIP family zinc transporter